MQALGRLARAAALRTSPSPTEHGLPWALLLPSSARGWETDTSYGRIFPPELGTAISSAWERDLDAACAGRTWHIPLPPSHEPDLLPFVQADGRGWTEAVISGARSTLVPRRGDQAASAGSGQPVQAAAAPPATVPAPSGRSAFVCRLCLYDGWR